MFRAGRLSKLEEIRESALSVIVLKMQAHVRKCLVAVTYKAKAAEKRGIASIQNNIRNYYKCKLTSANAWSPSHTRPRPPRREALPPSRTTSGTTTNASSRPQMLGRRHIQGQGRREERHCLHPEQHQELLQMQAHVRKCLVAVTYKAKAAEKRGIA